MQYKKSTLFLISVLVIIILAILFYLFTRTYNAPSDVVNNDSECLLFQSSDPKKSCFIANNAVQQPDNVTLPPQNNETLSPADEVVISSCISDDRNQTDSCIKKTAVTEKNTVLCSAISGALERSDCVSSVGRVDNPTKIVFTEPTVNKTALTATTTTVAKTGTPLSTVFTDMLDRIKKTVSDTNNNPDSRFTAEGFYERLATHTGLNLYAFSEYQVAPGSVITAQGTGFTKTGNTLYLGTYSLSGLESADGSTLSFTVPSLNKGTYEGWIENTNGSSKKDDRKIMLMITNSPTPKPVIHSVSPKVPLSTDTVIFSGENFSSSVNVMTTFGAKESVSASGGSFALKVSDLPFYEKVKTAPGVAGTLVSFFIYVYNENGVSGKPFTFDIQF